MLKLEPRSPLDEDDPSVMAMTFVDGSYDIDCIDRRIASYESRRNAALRELCRYHEFRMRQLNDVITVIDGQPTITHVDGKPVVTR